MADNSTNNKRIALNTIMLYIRMILVLGLSLYTSRVVLSALGITDFGIYNAVAGVSSMLTFFTSSLSNASQRFLSIELGKINFEGANKVFNVSLILFSFLCVILFVALETIGLWLVNYKMVIPEERLIAANYIYQFSVLICMLSVLQVPYLSSIIAEERMGIYAYLGIFDVVAKLIIVISLSYAKTDKLILYGLLLLIVQIVINTVYVLICTRQFTECKLKFYWDKALANEMFGFISYNAIGCFSWSVAYQGSSVLLNMFFGPVVNAARGVAMQINSCLNNFTSGIVTAVKPQIIKSYAAKDFLYMEQLIIMSSKYSMLLFILISFPVLFNIDFLLSVWLKEVPDYSNTFACLIIVDTLIAVLLQPINIALNATGKIINMQVYGRFITLAALPLSYLIYKYSLIESPNAVFVVLIVAEIGYWLYSYNDMKNQLQIHSGLYFKNVVFRVVLVVVSAVIVNSLVDVFMFQGVVDFITRGIINVLSLLVSAYSFAATESEKKWLNNKISVIIKRSR